MMRILKMFSNYLIDIGFLSFIKDKNYLQVIFKRNMGYSLDLNNPRTFNEKLQWLKLYDRKKVYTTMVDKYDVKKYVSNIISSKYIIPTLGIYNKFSEIDFKKLPVRFVIKCTHDSGTIIICKDKQNLNKTIAKIKFSLLLNRNFYYRFREWPYKNVKPKIIVEKYMGDNLNDYKIFCFNGVPKYILVCSNRNGGFKNTDFYDVNWNLMPFTREKHKNNPNGIPKPKNLKEMLDIAQKLAKDIPFVRVDLYDIKNKIYFGEMTFYPSAGFEGFSPKEWDKKLGDMIKLPKK